MKLFQIGGLAAALCLTILLGGCGKKLSEIPSVKTESPLVTTTTQATTTTPDDSANTTDTATGFTTGKSTGSTVAPQNGSSTGIAVAKAANAMVGAPYKSGGSGEEGFDTGSFVRYCFDQNSISVPRSVSGQATCGTAVSESDIEAGDIVVIAGSVGGDVDLTGIYIGDYQFVACTSKGVQTLSLTGNYWAERYIGARRPN